MNMKTVSNTVFRLRRNPSGSALFVFGVIQLFCIIAYSLNPEEFRYLSVDNIGILLRSLAPLVIISLGVGILMVSGEFDLSVGATFTMSALVMADCYAMGLPIMLSVAAALIVGIIIGYINSVLVLRFRITSFIATLGMMMMLRGLLLLYSGAQTKSFQPGDGFKSLLAGEMGVIQAPFLWATGLAVIAYLLMERHRLGNHILAVGGNADAANAVGINVPKIKTITFCISGLAASLAGVLSATRVESISPVQGQGYELQAIAACVVGGVALTGGRGSIVGIFIGAALIYTVQDILLLMSAPGYYLDAFVGLFIVCAAVLNRWVYRED